MRFFKKAKVTSEAEHEQYEKLQAKKIVDEEYKKIEKEVGKEGMAKLQVRAFFESILVESPTMLKMQKQIEALQKKVKDLEDWKSGQARLAMRLDALEEINKLDSHNG